MFKTICRVVERDDKYLIQYKKWYQRKWNWYQIETESNCYEIPTYDSILEATQHADTVGMIPMDIIEEKRRKDINVGNVRKI